MLNPQQFKKLTGFDIYQHATGNTKLMKAKRTYIYYLSKEMSVVQIIDFTGLSRSQVYSLYYYTDYCQEILTKLNPKTEKINYNVVPLFECLDILHKHPRHVLWDKAYNQWTKFDFIEINRLKDGTN